jgi:hypothetical protein
VSELALGQSFKAGKGLGRKISLAIDVFSRVVTGLHVSMSAPSRGSAGLLGTGSANPVSH